MRCVREYQEIPAGAGVQSHVIIVLLLEKKYLLVQAMLEEMVKKKMLESTKKYLLLQAYKLNGEQIKEIEITTSSKRESPRF